ncbi:hypothetical protein AV540_26215 [Brevibacillus parabrevis]|uniref:hypothetical protein n=1 Tax=Brevibacillus parabrevis TaxID=54914 RepID=UPI0007ABEA16|nr:hypothetical protein [Brevibacillus parabrevis]KZE55706.1 hypothetical protein AV540_26215 [Brevibacillus parabrevis]
MQWFSGPPYDFWQTITNRLYLYVGLLISDAADWMNCSEAVDRMFASAGIRLTSGDIGKVSPADLARSSLLKKVV